MHKQMPGTVMILYAFLICLLFLTACNSSSTWQGERLVDVGTHHLNIYCLGTGNPTVIIDIGWNDTIANWKALQERLARETRVCTYDRAGYGHSEPGPLPRTSKQIANELHALLIGAGVDRPVVLVGHSFGGLNVQVFAGQFSDQVAGMVLLDPPALSNLLGQDYPDLYQMALDMGKAFQENADKAANSKDPLEKAQASHLQTIASEHMETFGESAQQADDIQSFGDIPLVVIASGEPNPAFGEAYQHYWNEQCRTLAGKSSQGEFLLVKDSSHNLHIDAPDEVINAILSVIGTVNKDGP